MSLSLFLLILASGLLWSGFDVSRKVLIQRTGTLNLVAFLMWGQIPLFLLWAMLRNDPLPSHAYWLPSLIAVVLNLFANIFFVISVQKSALSLTIPMLSFTPVFSTLVSWALLGEVPSLVQWGGILSVIVGALFLHGSPWKMRQGQGNFRIDSGVLFMLYVSILWSIVPVIDKIALQSSSIAFHGFFQCLGIAMILEAVIRFYFKEKRQLAFLKSHYGVFLFAIFSAIGALVTQFIAIQMTLVGLFEALKRATGMIASQLLGKWIFQEALDPQKLIGVGIMVLGVALIVLF